MPTPTPAAATPRPTPKPEPTPEPEPDSPYKTVLDKYYLALSENWGPSALMENEMNYLMVMYSEADMLDACDTLAGAASTAATRPAAKTEATINFFIIITLLGEKLY